jgi:toxin HigB-1
MIDPARIRSNALKRFRTRGDASKLRPDWIGRVRRILSALNVAVSPEELRYPSPGWHQLTGDRAGTYSVTVSRNWRLTYRWDEDSPFDIDLEDYHGS